MAGAETIYYWDTCLFIAWIKDEQRPTGEMDGVREIIQRHKRREVKIVTSVLTMVEVLECKLPAGMETLFTGLMKRLDQRIGIDSKVASLAHDLRNYYSTRSTEFDGKTLATPDAIHLASAILNRVTEFHTFDDGGKGKSLGLLPLSGNVAGHKLTICKPQAKNPSLDLRKPPRQQATMIPSNPGDS
jgi:predicted nucleic acid-binding protein